MADNRERWKPGGRHDESCSSDYDYSNAKGTQAGSDLSESVGNADALSYREEDNATGFSLSSAQREKYSIFSHDTPNIHRGLLGASCQPGALQAPSSIRHKYVPDSAPSRTGHHSPITFKSPSPSITEMEDLHNTPPQVAFINPRRNTVASDGFETMLSEFHDRCRNNDEINQELEQKLQSKNRQISQNCVLLEQSRETIAKLQHELDIERREKCNQNEQLRKLIKESSDLERARKETDDAMMELRETITQADHQLKEKTSVANALREEMEDARASTRALEEQSEATTKQLQKDNITAYEEVDALKKDLQKHGEHARQLQETCTREEKARKHAEREVQLVTQQGQSLLEQQAVMRTQYQEDLDIHQSRIRMLEDLAKDKELQNRKIFDELKLNEQEALNRVDFLNETLQSMTEDYAKQDRQHGLELSEFQDRLIGKDSREGELLQAIEQLKEKMTEEKERFVVEGEHFMMEKDAHKTEIETLKAKHVDELGYWQQKVDEAIKAEKEAAEYKLSEFEKREKNLLKESLDLRCQIAEFEDKLESTASALSSMKDKIGEITSSREEAISKFNASQVELVENKNSNQLLLKERDVEISRLTQTVDNLSRDIEDSAKSAEQDIQSLNQEIEKLSIENDQLNTKLLNQANELSSLQSAFNEAKETAGQIQAMRALLSKKESSKAILVAEQMSKDREHSIVLSQKTSEVNDLEQEIASLIRENASLQAANRNYVDPRISSLSRDRSVENLPQTVDNEVETMTRTLLAKRESSNQILVAENYKIREELKNANTWWSRDVNELQKRNTIQTSVLGQMERKMTSLATENDGLKRLSVDQEGSFSTRATSDASNFSTKLDQRTTGFEGLFDHYKHELRIKDSRIKRLETSLQSAKGETNAALAKLETASEQEQSMKEGLEGKLTQNESHVEKIHSSLIQAQVSLENNDRQAAQRLVRRSNIDLQDLLKNMKSANESATGTLKLAADKQASLVELHNQFSCTLDQLQNEAESANTRQKQELENMQTLHEDQIENLRESIQKMVAESKIQSQKLVNLTTDRNLLQTALRRAEDKLRDMSVHATNAHQDIEIARAAKVATDSRVAELEETLEQIKSDKKQLESNYRLVKVDESMAKEREISQLRSKHEAKLASIEEINRKSFQEISMRLKQSDKDNIRLLSEVNRLEKKASKGSKGLEEEVQDLHGKVQRLMIEKSELSERFQDGLQTLKADHELILRERTDEIQRLHCQISELESKVHTIQSEYDNRKTLVQDLEKDKHCLLLENSEEKNKLKTQLATSEQKVAQLTEKTELDKRQLTKALDNATKLEIACVKLKNHIKQEVQQQKDMTSKRDSDIEKIHSTLSSTIALKKQLQSDNKRLRSSLKTFEAEFQLREEEISLLRQDLDHAESVCQLYKTKLESNPPDSDSIFGNDKSLIHSRTSIFPCKQNAKLSFLSAIPSVESTDGLGEKTARLTNEVSELQQENCLLQKKAEIAQKEQQSLLETSMKQTESIHSISRQRDEHFEYLNKLNVEHLLLQNELKIQRLKLKNTEEELCKLKAVYATTEKDNASLQKKLSETTILKDLASSAKIKSEVELNKNNSELIKQLHKERKSSLKIEHNLRNQTVILQSEMVTMKQHLEEAFEANRSLENYIRSLKSSYGSIFEEVPSPPSNNNEQTDKRLSRDPCQSSAGINKPKADKS